MSIHDPAEQRIGAMLRRRAQGRPPRNQGPVDVLLRRLELRLKAAIQYRAQLAALHQEEHQKIEDKIRLLEVQVDALKKGKL